MTQVACVDRWVRVGEKWVDVAEDATLEVADEVGAVLFFVLASVGVGPGLGVGADDEKYRDMICPGWRRRIK